MKKLLAFFTISIRFLSFCAFGQEPTLMLPIGHTDMIVSVAFSPDGKKVVTASWDKTAKVWDAKSGILLAELKGHNGVLSSATFSPDGKKIATASWDQTARVWDAQSGSMLAELKGHTGTVSEVNFSPDGKKIVTASDDKTAKVWDVLTGKLLKDLKEHTDRVSVAEFSPDGKKIVTSSLDKTAKIWDAQTGALLVNLKGHLSKVASAVFSPDGKIIATTAYDEAVKLWDVQSGNLSASLSGLTSNVSCLAFSPDGKKIVTASADKTVRLWNTQNGSLLAILKGHTSVITAIFFSPDNKRIMTVSEDETVKTWDGQNGMLLSDIKVHSSFLVAAAFSADGKKVVIGDMRSAEVWDMQTGKLTSELKGHTSLVSSAVFSPDKKMIATASDDGAAKIWDVQTGTMLASFNGHQLRNFAAVFSPDQKMFVTASEDSTAKIWDAQTGIVLHKLIGHTDWVWMAAFSQDGKRIITAANDNTPRLWNAQTGKLIAALNGHTSNISSAVFSHDGKKIVTSSTDHLIKIWDGLTGALLLTLKGHTGNINSTFFSPDDKRVLSSSFDSTARTWDVQTGRVLLALRGHTNCVYDAAFSPDGKKIATASFDGTGKIWDAQTGTALKNLKGHEGYVDRAIYSPDGKKIITVSSDDQTVKIWDAASGALLTTLKGHNSYIKSTDISADGKYIITACADNTLRKWNVVTGELLYTFFAVDSSDYLVVDKYNHYDGTAGGRKLLYFTCASEVIALDQVKDQLWVPNLAERINNGETINAKKLEELNLCGLTPETEMAEGASGEYRFIITPRRGGLGETILYVNGIEVRRYSSSQLMKNGGKFELNVKRQELSNYFIAGRENPVTVKAYTADNTIASRGIKVTVNESKQAMALPNLYAVMVGISDYKGDELDLKYAAKDATDISNAVGAAAKKLLNTDGKEHVFMYDLTTNKEHYQLPEKNSIKKLLEEIGKKATANDILLIFFAGHGKMEGVKKQFYFLTSDASPATATSAIADVGISTSELTEWMKPTVIKAQKRILIFDACNSGQAIKDFVKIGNPDQNYLAARNDEQGQQTKAIDKLNEQSGFFILSASASDQNAYEMGRYSQGLLTYSLLKAIKDQPDILEDGKYLNVSRWFNAAEKTVSDLSKESGARQQPQLITNTNFNIGIVDAEVMAKIVLPLEKPLFAASNFQNADENITDDNLELSTIINLQLNEISSRGAESRIKYVIATGSPDAYLLSGRYDVRGDALTVRVNIKQGKEIKYKFEVKGTKTNLKGLAETLVQQATDWIVKNK